MGKMDCKEPPAAHFLRGRGFFGTQSVNADYRNVTSTSSRARMMTVARNAMSNGTF